MVIVAVIVIAVGYAFVTGLAVNFIHKVAPKLNTFDVQEPPPPPPPDVPPPPPPPDQPQSASPPPVVSPPPIVRTPAPSPPVIAVPAAPAIVYAPTAAPAPPAVAPPAPPRVVSQAAGLKGNPGQYFGPDAYPPGALRAEAQGRVVAALTVGTDGRVSGCSVTTSSGNSDLDDATCRIAKRSVRFTAAKDASGAPIASSYTLPVRWVLPKD
ncbi:MAG: energy transducer TonB [Janthinobacterium lividum]